MSENIKLKAGVAQPGTAQTNHLRRKTGIFKDISVPDKEILFPQGFPGSNPGAGVLSFHAHHNFYISNFFPMARK